MDTTGTPQNKDAHQEALKVFVSYSRQDLAFADQIVEALRDKGYDPRIDRHAIHAAEEWEPRLGALIFEADTIVFVHTDASARSDVCVWEIEEAARLKKRIVPVVPAATEAQPHEKLAALNFIFFYAEPKVPGSGFYDGLRKLDAALSVDLDWLRAHTRLAERAAEWRNADRGEERLLRGPALADAEALISRPPAGSEVLDAVAEYVAAGADVEVRRKADAEADLAERERALEQARKAVGEREAAVEATATAEKRARKSNRRTLLAVSVGAAVATVLAVIAAVIGSMAVGQAQSASRNVSMTLTNASQSALIDGHGAAALRLGVLAARNTWLAPPTEESDIALVRAAEEALILAEFHAGAENVTSVAFGRNGALVATASADGRLQFWDVETGAEVTGEQRQDVLTESLAFGLGEASGAAILAESALWITHSSRDSELSPVSELVADLSHVTFSQDRSRVAGVSYDELVRVWDTESKAEVAAPKMIEGLMSHLAIETLLEFSPDGSRLACVVTMAPSVRFGSDGAPHEPEVRIYVWNLDTEEVSRLARGFDHHDLHTDVVERIIFSPNGVHLAIVYRDHTVEIWDVVDGDRVADIIGHASSVLSVAFTPDGRRLATATADGVIRLWDVFEGTELAALKGHMGPILSVAFSPDGARVASASSDHSVRVWGASTGEKFVRLGTVRSPDRRQVARRSDGYGVVLLDVDEPMDGPTGAVESFYLYGHDDIIDSMTFSADGSRLATASEDKTVRLWDTRTGDEIAVVYGLADNEGDRGSLLLSADGMRVVIDYTGDSGRLWNVDWPADYAGNALAREVCARRLLGSEAPVFDDNGDLTSAFRSMRRITETDADYAPILRDRIGEDVCVDIPGTPSLTSFWNTVSSWAPFGR